MMGKETLKLNRSLATNQQICATPHIAPLANAGPTHAGSCGSARRLLLKATYAPKYVDVARKMPQKCEKT